MSLHPSAMQEDMACSINGISSSIGGGESSADGATGSGLYVLADIVSKKKPRGDGRKEEEDRREEEPEDMDEDPDDMDDEQGKSDEEEDDDDDDDDEDASSKDSHVNKYDSTVGEQIHVGGCGGPLPPVFRDVFGESEEEDEMDHFRQGQDPNLLDCMVGPWNEMTTTADVQKRCESLPTFQTDEDESEDEEDEIKNDVASHSTTDAVMGTPFAKRHHALTKEANLPPRSGGSDPAAFNPHKSKRMMQRSLPLAGSPKKASPISHTNDSNCNSTFQDDSTTQQVQQQRKTTNEVKAGENILNKKRRQTVTSQEVGHVRPRKSCRVTEPKQQHDGKEDTEAAVAAAVRWGMCREDVDNALVEQQHQDYETWLKEFKSQEKEVQVTSIFIGEFAPHKSGALASRTPKGVVFAPAEAILRFESCRPSNPHALVGHKLRLASELLEMQYYFSTAESSPSQDSKIPSLLALRVKKTALNQLTIYLHRYRPRGFCVTDKSDIHYRKSFILLAFPSKEELETLLDLMRMHPVLGLFVTEAQELSSCEARKLTGGRMDVDTGVPPKAKTCTEEKRQATVAVDANKKKDMTVGRGVPALPVNPKKRPIQSDGPVKNNTNCTPKKSAKIPKQAERGKSLQNLMATLRQSPSPELYSCQLPNEGEKSEALAPPPKLTQPAFSPMADVPPPHTKTISGPNPTPARADSHMVKIENGSMQSNAVKSKPKPVALSAKSPLLPCSSTPQSNPSSCSDKVPVIQTPRARDNVQPLPIQGSSLLGIGSLENKGSKEGKPTQLQIVSTKLLLASNEGATGSEGGNVVLKLQLRPDSSGEEDEAVGLLDKTFVIQSAAGLQSTSHQQERRKEKTGGGGCMMILAFLGGFISAVVVIASFA